MGLLLAVTLYYQLKKKRFWFYIKIKYKCEHPNQWNLKIWTMNYNNPAVQYKKIWLCISVCSEFMKFNFILTWIYTHTLYITASEIV